MSSPSEPDNRSSARPLVEEERYEESPALEALPNRAGLPDVVDVEEAALFLRALSNENRLALLTLLQAGEQTVSTLAETLNMRQPAVSQQLGRLREAGLVDFRRDGKTVYYRLASERVRAFLPMIQEYFAV